MKSNRQTKTLPPNSKKMSSEIRMFNNNSVKYITDIIIINVLYLKSLLKKTQKLA